MSERYWILCKRDDAICGCVTGVQSQEVIAGPFDGWEKAYAHKASYQRHGSTFYTVTESSERPEEYERSYGFVDADREFDDVSDHAYCNDW
jgi:hypothetical protein